MPLVWDINVPTRQCRSNKRRGRRVLRSPVVCFGEWEEHAVREALRYSSESGYWLDDVVMDRASTSGSGSSDRRVVKTAGDGTTPSGWIVLRSSFICSMSAPKWSNTDLLTLPHSCAGNSGSKGLLGSRVIRQPNNRAGNTMTIK